jgi:hypothetical protein
MTKNIDITAVIACDNGHEYRLTQTAIERLRVADNGRTAEDVFDGFAAHVPRADRGRVWKAV